jgi:hypothetical protein
MHGTSPSTSFGDAASLRILKDLIQRRVHRPVGMPSPYRHAKMSWRTNS